MISKIFESIERGDYRYDKKRVSSIFLKLPRVRKEVYLPKEYAEEIKDLAREVADEYSDDLKPHKLKGFRLHKALISLVKASGLRDGRTRVNENDVERIRFLSNWMNLKMRKLKVNYPFS